jgi:hypothetical protein
VQSLRPARLWRNLNLTIIPLVIRTVFCQAVETVSQVPPYIFRIHIHAFKRMQPRSSVRPPAKWLPHVTRRHAVDGPTFIFRLQNLPGIKVSLGQGANFSATYFSLKLNDNRSLEFRLTSPRASPRYRSPKRRRIRTNIEKCMWHVKGTHAIDSDTRPLKPSHSSNPCHRSSGDYASIGKNVGGTLVACRSG